MNSLQATYEFIRNHPLGSRPKLRATNNCLGWQLRSRMRPGPHAVSFVGDTRLLVSCGMHGATGNIYCGLHEFEDMALVMHFLRPSDLWLRDTDYVQDRLRHAVRSMNLGQNL